MEALLIINICIYKFEKSTACYSATLLIWLNIVSHHPTPIEEHGQENEGQDLGDN